MDPDARAPYLLHMLGGKDPSGALDGARARGHQGPDVRDAAPDVRCAGAASGRWSSRSRISTGWTGRPRSTSRSWPRACSARRSCWSPPIAPAIGPPWSDRSFATQLSLGRLDRGREPRHRPVAPARRGRPRDPLAQLILDKAEGNPFFLEELTRAVSDQGLGGGPAGPGHRARRPHRAHRPARRGRQARPPDRVGARPGVRPVAPRGDLGRPGRRSSPHLAPARAAGVPLRAHDRRGRRVRLQARADAGRRRGDAPALAPPRAPPPGRRGARAAPPRAPRRAGAPARPSLRRGRGVGARRRATRTGPPRPPARPSRTGRRSPATTRPSRPPSAAGSRRRDPARGSTRAARTSTRSSGTSSAPAPTTRRRSALARDAAEPARRGADPRRAGRPVGRPQGLRAGSVARVARRSRPPSARATRPRRGASPPRRACASGSWSSTSRA